MRDPVTGHDDRDRALERLLPQVLGGVASTPCVDGETLAAWTEGALRSSEVARVEAHVADCARCQAMVGAFVRITPAPVVTESMWQRWRLNWLLPLATAAAAVALWAVIPSTSPGRQEGQVTLADARRDVPAPAATTPPPPAAEREAAPVAAPAIPTPSASLDRQPARRTEPEDPLRRRQLINEAAAPADALAKKKERDENAAAEAPRTLNETVSVGAAPAVVAPQTPGSQYARNDAPSEPAPAQLRIEQRKAVEERMAAAAPAAAPATPPAPAPSTAAAAGGRAAAADRATALKPESLSRVVAVAEIATPNAAVRWRITPGRLERTTTGGERWEPIALPDARPITAGAAPTVDVCWLVGRGGVVLVTTNGQRFTRVTFPEAVDLVAVRATDARTATVTIADGRTFRTTDGGANWTR